MAFQELEDFFDDQLELPIMGKTYIVPAVDAELGLRCQMLVEAGVNAAAGRKPTGQQVARLNDGEERELYEQLLGPAWDEMVADKVPWPRVKHAGTTVLVWTAMDRETAEQYWSTGSIPKARKRPADRKPSAKSAPRASTATKRASIRKASAGRRSSSTGR